MAVAGGACCLLYAGLPLLGGGQAAPAAAYPVPALAAAWVICRIINSRALAGTLSLRDCGLWEVALSGTRKTMYLTHAWPAFAWITLRFQDADASERQRPLELVVWRAGVPRRAWRALRVHIAGQAARPVRILRKESL